MKNVYVVLGMLIVSAVNVDARVLGQSVANGQPKAQGEVDTSTQVLTPEKRDALEAVQWKKIERQVEIARPPVYKMIDAAIEENIFFGGKIEEKIIVNWPTVFKIIDSMQGVISASEYETPEYGLPLLLVAVVTNNLLAAKELLEKYKVDPNSLAGASSSSVMLMIDGDWSFKPMYALMVACYNGDRAMVNLLLKYGANPNIKNAEGKNSFDYAANTEILKILVDSQKKQIKQEPLTSRIKGSTMQQTQGRSRE
jgi:hypothetical protein